MKVEGARRVWGTLSTCTSAVIEGAIRKICNINSVSIRRRSRVTPSGRQRWWFVLHDEESTLCALQEKWSSVEIQTSWKLESCYMPIPSPSVSDLPRVASVNNLRPESAPLLPILPMLMLWSSLSPNLNQPELNLKPALSLVL